VVYQTLPNFSAKIVDASREPGFVAAGDITSVLQSVLDRVGVNGGNDLVIAQ